MQIAINIKTWKRQTRRRGSYKKLRMTTTYKFEFEIDARKVDFHFVDMCKSSDTAEALA